jgi:putative transposase
VDNNLLKPVRKSHIDQQRRPRSVSARIASPDKTLLKPVRKSHVDQQRIYFWTATINKWQRLLEKDPFKDVIISSLQYLSDRGKIDVFAFVIMPTHLHFIWRVNEPNGKESPHGSFMKYTAHAFQKMLHKEGENALNNYKIDACNKRYEFWKPDSLAIPLFSKKVAMQKLNYIHRNPLAGRWRLAKDPCGYKYSSARYYEMNEKDFPFLRNLWDEL